MWSGCGAVGREVASDLTDTWFESLHFYEHNRSVLPIKEAKRGQK